jgi:hypothetical protein
MSLGLQGVALCELGVCGARAVAIGRREQGEWCVALRDACRCSRHLAGAPPARCRRSCATDGAPSGGASPLGQTLSGPYPIATAPAATRGWGAAGGEDLARNKGELNAAVNRRACERKAKPRPRKRRPVELRGSVRKRRQGVSGRWRRDGLKMVRRKVGSPASKCDGAGWQRSRSSDEAP